MIDILYKGEKFDFVMDNSDTFKPVPIQYHNKPTLVFDYVQFVVAMITVSMTFHVSCAKGFIMFHNLFMMLHILDVECGKHFFLYKPFLLSLVILFYFYVSANGLSSKLN